MGLDMSSHYPPRAPFYSHTGLRPLCCELCPDNGHFPPVWVYQADRVALGVPLYIQNQPSGTMGLFVGSQHQGEGAGVIYRGVGGFWGALWPIM